MAVRQRRIGLISDTHGLLRPEAVEALRGSEFIVHAGDIGEAAILGRLSGIAPVTAVRGNNDKGSWAAGLNEVEILKVDDAIICVVHDLAQLDVDPAAAGIHAVVSGHSHRPAIREANGILYVNPGSAGPRRFSLPVSVGSLVVAGARVRARLVTLDV
ncbi:MAG TPA: metallophosphoesterase family protein [Burkholderiales bacterium]|nr:metallophosphoesterase family protein [Burkholderiales bacterium]